MKRTLLIGFCLTMVASLAFAQAGSIGVFADTEGTNCNLTDAGLLVTVQIVQVFTVGSRGVQFMLVPPAGWTHLGDVWNFPTIIGVSISGVSVAWSSCEVGPVSLGLVNFFGAEVPACSIVGIVADETAPSGFIEGVDCDRNKVFPTGGEAFVNSDGSCDCSTPVQETTWGGVKALYN